MQDGEIFCETRNLEIAQRLMRIYDFSFWKNRTNNEYVIVPCNI